MELNFENTWCTIFGLCEEVTPDKWMTGSKKDNQKVKVD